MKPSIFRDRDGKLSIARIGMFWTMFVATLFFGKSLIWGQPIPAGVISGLGSVAGAMTCWNAATKFSKSDKEKINE